jgi:hypothetical protein
VDWNWVKQQALARLSPTETWATNLYLDRRLHLRGTPLGPALQRLRAPRDCVLVFADDHPLRNFAHDCRYFLYDATTGDFFGELNASFPPYGLRIPVGYERFHYVVPNEPLQGSSFGIPHPPAVVLPVTSGRRHAILFSGSNELRQLNTLEFCYRTLVDHFGFATGDIHVLFADGTLRDPSGNVPCWSGGDGKSQLTMGVAGKAEGRADKKAFKKVLKKLKLHADDLLFIHTEGHGSNDGTEGTLVTYDSAHFSATDFGKALKALPKHRALIVMMGQCNAGGFNDQVIAASKAAQTTIASAVSLGQASVATVGGIWNAFACNWIAAQLGFEPDGVTPVNADANGDDMIEAQEAFDYAVAANKNNPPGSQDDPVQKDSSPDAADLTLGATLSAPLTWDALIAPAMQKYDLLPATAQNMKTFRERALPKLQKLVLPALRANTDAVRRALEPKIDAIIKSALGPQATRRVALATRRPPRRVRGPRPSRARPAADRSLSSAHEPLE